MEALEQVRQALDMGFPAIVMMILFALWAEYRAQVRGRIEDLREMAGLRANLPAANTSKKSLLGDELASSS